MGCSRGEKPCFKQHFQESAVVSSKGTLAEVVGKLIRVDNLCPGWPVLCSQMLH